MTRQERHFTWGAVIIVLGLILLINSIGFWEIDIWRLIRLLWPLALIIIGLILIFKNTSEKEDRAEIGMKIETLKKLSRSDESNAFGLFGDIRIAGMGQMSGVIEKSLLIGDIVIDLTGSRLASGENQIEVSVLIGDIDIFVPDDFPISAELNGLVASLEIGERKSDGLAASVSHKDSAFAEAESKLSIRGRVLIGDIKIHHRPK